MPSTLSPLRLLLVDDEAIAIERLRMFLAEMPETEVVGEARDGEAALAEIERLSPDGVVLDTQMPGRGGMAVARALMDRPDAPEVVFVTAFEQFAPDAFDVDAADYLLKPVRLDRLRHAVDRIRRRRRLRDLAARAEQLPDETQDSASLRSGLWVAGLQGRIRVGLSDIQWIEAAKDYVLIHTGTRTHILRSTMGALEDELRQAHGLRRVHRSAFVNLGAVTGTVQPGSGAMTLVLEGGTEVPVGPSYIGVVSEALALRR